MGYGPVPASPAVLGRYMAYLGRRLKFSSIRHYLSAVRLLHLESGFPNPLDGDWFLSSLMKGMKRFLGVPVRQKSPITPDLLLQIRELLDFSNHFDIVFWAACLLMFFSLLRKSNVFPPSLRLFSPSKHLCRGDLSISSPNLPPAILVVCRWTKTIQFRERTLTCPLPFLPGHPLCPATALAQALRLSVSAPSASPALMYKLNNNWCPMLYKPFLHKLKSLLQTITGDSASFAAHSFRRGGASWALQQGIPGEVIRVLGDWKSMAYLSYITVPLEVRCRALSTFSENLPTTTS